MTTIMAPPPMATCLAFYPRDNNILAVGMDNSSIIIYNVRTNKVYISCFIWENLCIIAYFKEVEASFVFLTFIQLISKLEGHSERVTAVAFSSSFILLVSGDINAQVSIWPILILQNYLPFYGQYNPDWFRWLLRIKLFCHHFNYFLQIFVWNTNVWDKQIDRYLQTHGQKVPEVLSETHIQFHPYQMHFLAVRNNHLAIYEATDLRCVNQVLYSFPHLWCAFFPSKQAVSY